MGSFDIQTYKNNYDKENYYKPTIRIPKEKKAVVDAIALKKGKSVNTLFVEAFEKQYKCDLTIVESKLTGSK